MEPKNEAQEIAQEATTTPEEPAVEVETTEEPAAEVEAAEEPALEERVRQLVTRLVNEELETARAEGYRRGRNDRIATLTHDLPTVTDDDTDDSSPVPHLARRSIWDC